MDIMIQAIRIIDYENDKIIKRDAPQTFSNYVEELIDYISTNTVVRKFETRSNNTEVISCIKNIIQNKMDDKLVNENINTIAKRLLSKEREAQKSVARMNTNVQKGSLIQALMYDEEKNEYIYLLAKVEHIDFVDDADFSFKSGFSKDKNKLWKSCIFTIDDIGSTMFFANVYSNTSAKYWHDDFLELKQVVSDAVNSERAFRAINSLLKRNVKKYAPSDYAVIRNAAVLYFKSHEYIDYDILIQTILGDYKPIELEQAKMDNIIEKARALPDQKEFDQQFNTVFSSINPQIKQVYKIRQGVQLTITDAIDNFDETIRAYRDNDGNKYLQIKTDNEKTYQQFFREFADKPQENSDFYR